MATRIYVAKYGVNAAEDDSDVPTPALEAWHYIDAMRSGGSAYPDVDAIPSLESPAYVDEVSLLRQWIMPLDDYIQKYESEALAPDGRLYLNLSFGSAKQRAKSDSLYKKLAETDAVGFTRRALLIFGSYTTLGTNSQLAVDLQTDPKWQQIKTICASGADGDEPMFATFFNKKFGTDHKKLFIMIASQQYEGKAKDGFPMRGIWNNEKEVDARKLDRWIVDMARMGHRSKEESFGRKNPDWVPVARAVPEPTVERDYVLEDVLAQNAYAEMMAKYREESRPNPSGVTKTNPGYRKKTMPKDLLEKKEPKYPRHKFGQMSHRPNY
jgi:hypothetical protein